MVDGYRLGVDFGTSNTTAVMRAPDGRRTRLVFGRDNLLPSAVCAQDDGSLLVGRDALRAARIRPECFEPHPKKRIDEQTVLLGTHEVAVPDVIGAVLARVFRAAGERAGGEPVRVVTLTHPAGWGGPRQELLRAAAAGAGAAAVELVPEPIAAGTYLLQRDTGIRPGACVLVYDFGAGTFDASVIRCDEDLTVLAAHGLPNVGGLDIDQAIFDHLGEVYGTRPGWSQLRDPSDAASRRASNLFRDDLREAKEALARASTTQVHVPILDTDAVLGRETLDRLARPIVEHTIRAAHRAVLDAGLAPGDLDAIYLVGGSSRLPQVSTMLLERFRIAAEMPDEPEFAVAEGSLTAVAPARTAPAAGNPAGTAPEPTAGNPAGTAPEPTAGNHAGTAPEPTAAKRAATDPAVVEDDQTARYHLAAYHYRHGNLREAEQEIGAVVEAALSPEHPTVLEGRLLWGELLLLRLDVGAAAQQFQQVRDARRAALGARDRATLQARYHLGRCRVQQIHDAPRPAQITVLSRVNGLLDEQRRAVGPDDPDTLATQALAAMVEVRLGERQARTEPTLRAVLAAQQRLLAPDDPATYRTWLGLVQALGVWQEWETGLREAIALNRLLREHGDGHPLRLDAADAYSYLRTRHALALAADPARAEEAKTAHANAVNIADAALRKHQALNGDTHPRTIRARYRYADCLIEAGQRVTGMAQLHDAVQAGKRVLGRHHPATWQLWVEFAERLTQQGDSDRAEEIYRAAVVSRAQFFGEDSTQAAEARDRLAEVVRRNATLPHRMKRWLRNLAD